MTGRCVTVTGKRVAADFFIASYNARPKRPPEPVCVLRNGEMCVRGPGNEAMFAGVGYRLITAG
jgi:hypothetical protein